MEQDKLLTEMAGLRLSLRRTQLLLVSLALAFGFLATYERFSSRRELKSRSFKLLDRAGNEVAAMSPQGDGACINLYGPSKEAAINVCSTDGAGSFISLMARNGETQSILSTGETTIEPLLRFPPGLEVSTQYGQKIFSVRLGADSRLAFGDRSGLRGLTVVIPDKGDATIDMPGGAHDRNHRKMND